MKKNILLFFTIIIVLSCKMPSKLEKLSNVSEELWYPIIQALLISGIEGDKTYIYYRYENNVQKEFIEASYDLGHDIYNYEINDSIVHYINSRTDNIISMRLDTIDNVEFIVDTIGFNNYFLLSEPFFITNDRLFFTVTNKKLNSEPKYWIYFFYKNEDSLKISGYYDVQEETFYNAMPLN